jgi:molybdate transport system regulatory protein
MKTQAYNIAGSLVIYRNSEVFISLVQYRLLNQINTDGSINAAAKNMKISYQHAWHLINKMNQLSPMPVVISQKGGKYGGGCFLSEYGMQVLKTYAQREAELYAFLSQSNDLLNDELI